MKITHLNQSIIRKNSDACIVTEYPMDHKGLDFAIVELEGRYPDKGYAVNQICDEIVYVQEGEGSVSVNGTNHALHAGDVILIESKDKFVWNGSLKLIIACNPAFHVEQHMIYDENDMEQSDKPKNWNSLLVALQRTTIPDDFLNQEERRTHDTERDPFEG